MSRTFGPAPELALRQGEVLKNFVELRPEYPKKPPSEDDNVPVVPITHPYLVLLTADCDLEQDFKGRYPDRWYFEDEREAKKFAEKGKAYQIDNTVWCKAYTLDDIRGVEGMNSSTFGKIKSNSPDQRYQRLGPANLWSSANEKLDLVLDFKKVISIPTEGIYNVLDNDSSHRMTVIRPLHLQNLVQRFYSYHSRIGIEN